MKTLYVLIPIALAGVAGCATSDEQYAQKECKIVALQPAHISGTSRNTSELAQRQAEMDLASSSYRQRHINRPGFNNVEDALRDCY